MAMTHQRVLIVSNRLPVTLRTTSDGVTVAPSCGGLGTGLGSSPSTSGGIWVGWPGAVFRGPEQRGIDDLLRPRRIVPVHLTGDQVSRSYDGFANRVLW